MTRGTAGRSRIDGTVQEGMGENSQYCADCLSLNHPLSAILTPDCVPCKSKKTTEKKQVLLAGETGYADCLAHRGGLSLAWKHARHRVCSVTQLQSEHATEVVHADARKNWSCCCSCDSGRK